MIDVTEQVRAYLPCCESAEVHSDDPLWGGYYVIATLWSEPCQQRLICRMMISDNMADRPQAIAWALGISLHDEEDRRLKAS